MAKKPAYEKLEQRVKHLERDFNNTLIQASPAFFVAVSADGKTKMMNEAILNALGYTQDEITGTDYVSTFIPEGDRDMVSEIFETLVKLKRPTVSQNRVLTKEGKELLVEWHGRPIFKENGEYDFFLGIGIDITKARQVEEALQKSEKRFRHLIEGSIQGIFIHRKLKPIFVNQAYADIFGYSIKEILEMDTVLSQFASFEQDRIIGYMNARLKGEAAPTQYEYQGIKKDGSPIWLENRVKMVEGWGKDTIQTTVFDITDRMQAEDTLKKRSYELSERVKELNCLYGLSKILETSGISGIVNIIPPAFRYPDIACACISIGDRQSRTKNFKETAWKLKSDIVSRGECIGSLKVCYLEEKPERYEGPFIKEERNLINAVAERLGKIVEHLRADEALKESEEKLRYLSSSLLKAQEKERQRISFGLHDELGQDLAALKIQLKSIEKGLQENQKGLKEACASTRQHVDHIVENVRRISRGLSPTILKDLGLSATLKWMIQNFTEQTHIKASLDMADIDNLFSEEAQIIIYRIFQEAFTNIRKHSRATHVSVGIKKRKNDISFMVEDNGRGFDMQEVETRNWPKKGMGLITMEERARILGGPFERFSRKGQGTRVTLTIPINKKGSGQ